MSTLLPVYITRKIIHSWIDIEQVSTKKTGKVLFNRFVKSENPCWHVLCIDYYGREIIRILSVRVGKTLCTNERQLCMCSWLCSYTARFYYRITKVSPHIKSLGPYQPPKTSLHEGCVSIVHTLGQIVEMVRCDSCLRCKLNELSEVWDENNFAHDEYDVSV